MKQVPALERTATMELLLELVLRLLLLPVEFVVTEAIWRLPVFGRVLIALGLLAGLGGLRFVLI